MLGGWEKDFPSCGGRELDYVDAPIRTVSKSDRIEDLVYCCQDKALDPLGQTELRETDSPPSSKVFRLI